MDSLRSSNTRVNPSSFECLPDCRHSQQTALIAFRQQDDNIVFKALKRAKNHLLAVLI